MYVVAALYRFAPFDDPSSLSPPLLALCRTHGVKGTLLLAHEGINGTIAGTEAAIDTVLTHIRSLPGCDDIEVKYSQSAAMPFHRMKVRLKKEIVTLCVPGIDPARDVGEYVEPHDWNELIRDPNTIVIDTRNAFEVAIGRFHGAIDPATKHFSDFPSWFEQHKDKFADQPRVAMYCTGGIRCEKSTAFLLANGIKNVFHLKGGILKYLEKIPAAESLWEGECFVFDERVAVGHDLVLGEHTLCRACRMPLNVEQRQSKLYIEGVQCPLCADERSDEQRHRYAERHKQMQLAAERGYRHVGDLDE